MLHSRVRRWSYGNGTSSSIAAGRFCKNEDYRVRPCLDWIAVNSNQSTQVPTTAFAVRLHGAFRLAIASRAHELKRRRNLDKIVFVLTHMVESLSHGAVLRRPSGLSLAAAKEEVVRAVLALCQVHSADSVKR